MSFAPTDKGGQKLGQIFENEFGVEPGSFFVCGSVDPTEKFARFLRCPPRFQTFFPPADITYALLDILPRAMVKLKNAQRRE